MPQTNTEQHTKNVVIIEDNINVASLMRLALKKLDLNIFHASNGATGLQLVQDSTPDLIILDLMMPGMNGWEVYRQLQERNCLIDTFVLVVTSLQMRGDRHFAEHVAKVDGYLRKPFLPSELVETVSKLLFNSE